MPTRKKAKKAPGRKRATAVRSRKVAKKAAKKAAGKAAKKRVKKAAGKAAKKRVKKAAGKTAKKRVKKTAWKRAAKRLLRAVAVGDAVKLPAEARNLIGRYDPSTARRVLGAESVEGLVCSIRTIKTGKLVAKTRGDLSRYVLEVIHSETFRRGPPFQSADAPGAARPMESPLWQRLRALLQEAAGKKQLLSVASGGLSEEPYKSLLDGWRVVKVKAALVEAVD